MPEEINPLTNLSADYFTPFSSKETANILPVTQADWLKMTEKLSQTNKDLLAKIGQLETALIECRAEFSVQQQRVQSQDTLLLQQTEDLGKAEEQVNILFHELESSHQVAQKQQVLIQNLSEQLDDSQERINQLEQQCQQILKKYQEQAKLLQESENNALILRARLQMQQRHTSQFKTALEKYLQLSPDPKNLHTQAMNLVTEWHQEDQENLQLTENLIITQKTPANKTKTEPAKISNTPTPDLANPPHISTQKLVEIAQHSADVDDMIDKLYTVFGDRHSDENSQNYPSPQTVIQPQEKPENEPEKTQHLFHAIPKDHENKRASLNIQLPKLPQKNHEN
jgi:DNA-binding ferritin-like protein